MLVLAILAIAHLVRLIWRTPITVDGAAIPMGSSVIACIVLGLVASILLIAIWRKRAGASALFLAAPLLAFIAIAHALRLIFHVEIIVAGVPIPMWASIVACILPGLIVLMLWRESRNNELVASYAQPDYPSDFFNRLTIPWVDRTIAIVAVLPFAYIMFVIVRRGQLNLPLAAIAINHLTIVATMVLRTAPVRITPNPWYWLLAFVATYGGLYAPALARTGVAIVPDVVSNSLSILSLSVLVFARLSLGRSMGFVPAQRVIVTSGAYRFVRHPIYTGIFISFLSWTLHVYSLRSMVIAIVWCTLFVIKSFIEEGFLREDPEYAAYLARVRRRWFPGLV